MRVKPLHKNFKMPVRSSELAGGYDIFMPEAGSASEFRTNKVGLGFAAEVPVGHVALILPRSGAGSKFGIELNNTVGVIDSDYRGEWIATIKTKNHPGHEWVAHDRLFQFLIVPVVTPTLEYTEHLDNTVRGAGGFGSTGA